MSALHPQPPHSSDTENNNPKPKLPSLQLPGTDSIWLAFPCSQYQRDVPKRQLHATQILPRLSSAAS